MGRLERHLDPDAIRRIASGIRPHTQAKPTKHLKPRKLREEYRGARRNAARGFVWDGILARPEPIGSFGKIYPKQSDKECWRRRKKLIQQQRAAQAA